MMAPQTGDNVTDGRRDASHVFYPSDRHARGGRCDRKRLLSHEPELVDDCCPGGGAYAYSSTMELYFLHDDYVHTSADDVWLTKWRRARADEHLDGVWRRRRVF